MSYRSTATKPSKPQAALYTSADMIACAREEREIGRTEESARIRRELLGRVATMSARVYGWDCSDPTCDQEAHARDALPLDELLEALNEICSEAHPTPSAQ